MDITSIPMEHRIVVAQSKDGWVLVLRGQGIDDEPNTWIQAHLNCPDWNADPATCKIVDAREPEWQAVKAARRDYIRSLMDEQEGE